MKSMLRNLNLTLILIAASVGHAGAQCSGVPSTYAGACSELTNYLNSFQATLPQNIQKSSVAFSGETLYADSNRGIQALLTPQAYAATLGELNADALVGMQAITLSMAYPLLYQPFYAAGYSGVTPDEYTQIVTFYQNVINEAHKRGLKVIVESSILFPNSIPSLTQALTAWYSSLTLDQLTAGRAQTALTIAQLGPDFLNLGSEPDTQSSLLIQSGFQGINGEFTPQQYATLVSTILTQLRSAGIHGHPLIGAGCGVWQSDTSGTPNAASYISALVATDLDYIDFHIYSVNLNYLANTPGYIDMARAAGKPAAISEAWMKKLTDSQLQGKSDFQVIQTFASSPIITADAFSFWAPLDAQFLTDLVALANWKDLLYISPFPVQYFFAYVDYAQSGSSSDMDIQTQASKMANTNMAQGNLSATGQAYSSAVASANRPMTVSGASYTALVASDSIVSIFAPNLASGNFFASSVPLPTDLGNISVTVTDNSGTQMPAGLFYAGPSQINAAVPPGLASGLIALTITTPSGGQTSAVKSAPVAPSLFAAEQNGKGIAAAQTQVGNNISNATACSSKGCSAVPIDVASGNTYLILYGTGIRGRSSQSDVTVTVGSQTLPVSYADRAPGYVALDQVNVLLPASLAGSGNVNVSVSVAGAVSNVLTVDIK